MPAPGHLHRRGVAPPPPRAIALVIVGQAVGAEVLAADGGQAVINDQVFGVQVAVAAMHLPRLVAGHEPARPTGAFDDPAGGPLLILSLIHI